MVPNALALAGCSFQGKKNYIFACFEAPALGAFLNAKVESKLTRFSWGRTGWYICCSILSAALVAMDLLGDGNCFVRIYRDELPDPPPRRTRSQV